MSRWIAWKYEGEMVELVNFNKNNSTCAYLLSIKINDSVNMGTVCSTNDL